MITDSSNDFNLPVLAGKFIAVAAIYSPFLDAAFGCARYDFDLGTFISHYFQNFYKRSKSQCHRTHPKLNPTFPLVRDK